MPDYYDRKGRPLTMRQWARLWETNPDGYRQLALTEIGEYQISTVWLGLDHNHLRFAGGVPLIFETMVFPLPRSVEVPAHPFMDVCERYPTEEAALAGHDQVVARVRREIFQDL